MTASPTPARPAALRVAVAGGTGTVGRHVVAALTAAGHESVPLSRSADVDVVSGEGLAAALDGVDAVVDATNVQTLRRRTAERFFTATTTNLLGADVPHLVVLSTSRRAGGNRTAAGRRRRPRHHHLRAMAGRGLTV